MGVGNRVGKGYRSRRKHGWCRRRRRIRGCRRNTHHRANKTKSRHLLSPELLELNTPLPNSPIRSIEPCVFSISPPGLIMSIDAPGSIERYWFPSSPSEVTRTEESSGNLTEFCSAKVTTAL